MRHFTLRLSSKAGTGQGGSGDFTAELYEAYRELTRLRDCWKTLPDETIDRYFNGVIQKFLQAYHELEGKESQRETPWQ